ncbi:MAG: c-type cytochrome [Hydrogenophilaceae bacterium]|nr:c-type cytochrome [Hydrogenophilaceae bacterium]
MVPRLLTALALSTLAFSASANSEQLCGKEAQPCVKYGAAVFQERCTLCHGTDGLGEGILSLSIPGYPNTNLAEVRHAKDIKSIREVIIKGAGTKTIEKDMPPFGDELTLTQIDSVTEFVVLLRADLDGALKLSREASSKAQPGLRVGRAVYHGRCAPCHGNEGMGDGKLSRIIKTPPPFNLTRSRVGDSYLRGIITKGGEAMGRSAKMPPWGGDLTPSEIESVMMYIKTLRTE